MATFTIKHFDVHEYVKKSKELGVSEEVAEYQARQIEQLSETIQAQRQEIETLKQSEPASRKDIELVKFELQKEIEMVRKEISQSSNKIILWVAGLVMASGVIQHFFK